MDDITQARERGGRLDELPAHEDDSDVADQVGGGVVEAGGTAEVRGTGERRGNAQGLDDEAPAGGTVPSGDRANDTPGFLDFTDPGREPDTGRDDRAG